MLTNLEAFLSWAKENKWTIRQNRKGDAKLPLEVLARYDFPEEYLAFMNCVRQAITPEGTGWFQLEDEFSPPKDMLMHWNEYEILTVSLATDDGDTAYAEESTAFWAHVLPIFISVGEGFAYFGIDTTNENRIVFGAEPAFHEPQIIADSLDELLGMFAKGEIELAE